MNAGRHSIVACALSLSFLSCTPTEDVDPLTPPGVAVESIDLQRITGDLTAPVGLDQPPGETERLYVVDQTGQIRIINNDTLQEGPFIDVSSRMVELTAFFDERGLLSIAFHPQYQDNGLFYLFYNAPSENEPSNSIVRVSEFTAIDADHADLDSERILLEIEKPQFNHNGGQLAFGPDGFLYIGVGDGGGAGDSEEGHTPGLGNGQDLSQLLGKILRIDVDSGDPYGIPSDNPFVDDPDVRDEIWAYGLRNPWRFSFDSGGDQRLFAGDVGQLLTEEVNIIASGGNYGWNVREGTQCFDAESVGIPPDDCATVALNGDPFLDPIIEYAHVDDESDFVGNAIIGGYVYRGNDVPGLVGQYVFADYSTSAVFADGTLLAAQENDDGRWTVRELAVASGVNERINRFIFGFGVDNAGELYILTSESIGPTGDSGEVYRIIEQGQ